MFDTRKLTESLSIKWSYFVLIRTPMKDVMTSDLLKTVEYVLCKSTFGETQSILFPVQLSNFTSNKCTEGRLPSAGAITEI
jgi:hypothetical protein